MVRLTFSRATPAIAARSPWPILRRNSIPPPCSSPAYSARLTATTGPSSFDGEEYAGEEHGVRIRIAPKIGQSDLAAMAGVRAKRQPDHERWRKRNIVTRSSEYYCINDPVALALETEADG